LRQHPTPSASSANLTVHPYWYPAICAQLYYITILIPESHPHQSLQVNIESIGLCMVTRGVGQTQEYQKYHDSYQLDTLPSKHRHISSPQHVASHTVGKDEA